ncbi:FAD-dependent oxidoreductase [Silvanigrella paludirubra]|uniref:FAD-dependent oxidoreductase n=1 Tax=Silvanigrella paludirubra TaxID=2499159 RepID=A0A6N6VNY5_9BACT|nr:FAD-dependent oxidoreductase [Silvanigrella paludirubra]KAB8036868.1 FAD-dependent oxidoreductase [Silvanigrella paludirubra]
MTNNQFFDVIIVGAGAFSCFSALLLKQKGMNVAVVYSENTSPMESFLQTLNTCWPSLNDPPTRAEVAHGHEVALYLHEFCIKGLNYFKETLLPLIEDQNNWLEADCFRIGAKDFEVEELVDAFNLGFGLKKTENASVFKEDKSSLICLNSKLFQENIIKSLAKNNVTLIPYDVIKLEERQSKCILELKNNSIIESEIVVLGSSLNIAKIMPKFQSILIPMSDSLFEYELDNPENSQFKPINLRASNGHICASVFNQKDKIKIKLSGPRFLLPGAGAGFDLTKKELDNKVFQNIEKYHREIVFNLIANLIPNHNIFINKSVELISKKILVDCYPCDELPLLGEYGKLGRILGNTGWLATGLSSGSWAASIICELILNEKSLELHSRLHPRRLFTKFVNN